MPLITLLIQSTTSKAVCYPYYSPNGCFTCQSHEDVNCGYCSSVMSCLPGDATGPVNAQCNSSNWFFDKSYCSDAFCSSFKTRRDCKYPCAYSRLRGCIYNVEYQIHISQMTNIALCIVCGIMIIILGIIIYQAVKFYKFYKCSTVARSMLKNNYVLVPIEEIQRMKNINLDEIPSPNYEHSSDTDDFTAEV